MDNAVIQSKMKSIKSKIEKWIEQGHLKDAMEALDDYEAMIPGDPDIYSMRAVIHIIEGDLDKAEAVLGKGLSKDSVQFDLLFNLAYIRELQGKAQDAADLYLKAETVAFEDNQKQSVAEAIERIKAANDSIELKEKDKVVFFVKAGLDNFLTDIIKGISDDYWVRKIIVSDLTQIDEGMEWADICWFEWCDELIAYGSGLPAAYRKKIVCRVHRYEVFTEYPGKVAWENVDTLILVTGHLKEILEMNFPGITEKVKTIVIDNGVDVNRYPFKKRSHGFNLAYVGYIHSRKNPPLLLQIIEKLVRIDKRYKLYVAGHFQDQLVKLYWEYQVKRMGLSENVIFDGWQEDISAWLEDKNYLVSASIHESFGYGIAEAMARGIKPIIHDFLHADEIWSEEYLFNSVDEAVESISNGKYESEEYRAFIENNYSLKKQLAQIRDLFRELSSVKVLSGRIKDIILGKESPQELMREDITVLIPSYNRAKMLKFDLDRGLKLGKQQKLIVDDCSTQETQWLDKIEGNKDVYRTEVIRKRENEGVALTRFAGLQNIKTRLTTFLDDDDMLVCIDQGQAQIDIDKLSNEHLLIIPRYLFNLSDDKLSLGYDRECYDNCLAEDVLRRLASESEMRAMLAGGATGATEKLKEHALSRGFIVSEDFVMLARMLSANRKMKIGTTESLVYVRRVSDRTLSRTYSPAKYSLWLISQAVACYYCLTLGIAEKEEVLKWMKDRADLIQQLYGFGESFEAELFAYLKGEISEDYFTQVLWENGVDTDKGLDYLAPELRKLRGIFYIEPEKGIYEVEAKQSGRKDGNENINNYSRVCRELYNVNLIESLSKSSKLFSIVIPTRNSAKYLRHTLMTCLNQRFDDYEILVSDNSTPGNDETLKLVKELDSDKIRYIKPATELSLVKSFEFAYLNSQGEYIFGLGSDDALLFHSLDFLSKVLAKYNNEKVILWDKLFYCWPGVSDKTQENLFFVSRMYRNDKVDLKYLDSNAFLKQILNFDVSMYMLPMVYINSAIHRSVMKKVIEKTGIFLGGLSQDVYTGLINLALFDRILYIMHPIVIAGMSQNSIGFTSHTSANKQILSDAIKLRDKFNEKYTNKLVPQVSYDRNLLVTEFLRIIEKGINNWDRSMVNWKKFFAMYAEFIKNDEAGFREKLNEIKNTIKVHNDRDLEDWFDKNYYYNRDYLERKIGTPYYQKGFFSDSNALRIDMSKFGIDNIYDVAVFFNNLYNLG